jgi:hypothetical protein
MKTNKGHTPLWVAVRVRRGYIAFYVRDKIDVGIEVLAMKCLQEKMSSGPGYFEGGFSMSFATGGGPAVPLDLVGVAP